jgi:hypothetical protein
MWMNRIRRNLKRKIQCCGLSHVVMSQSRPRCALGLHQDRHDVHFRRHHALAGSERLEESLEDMAAWDTFCEDSDRCPGKPGYRRNCFYRIELTNCSAADCSR